MDKTLCQPDTYDLSEDEVLALITAERVRVKKPNGMCPLHYAAHYTTSKAVVDAIIAEYPEALQAKNNYGETPGVRVLPSVFVRELSSLRPVHFLLFTGHGAEPRANRPT